MKLNNQIKIKQDLNPSGKLKIFSIFNTIQGEGIFVGEPATFVRLYGCNLECPLCDTDYTSHFTNLAPFTLADTVNKKVEKNRLVVITGGEPFRQNIAPFVNELLELGLRVQIETNGTLFVKGIEYEHENLSIMCSPKTGKVNKFLEPYIDAYKYVLHADEVALDGLPTKALDHSVKHIVARPKRKETPIFLQPVDVQDEKENERHLKAAIFSCMNNGYRFGLQVHKIINME